MPKVAPVQIMTVMGTALVQLKAWSPIRGPLDLSGAFHLKQLGPTEWLAISDAIDGPTLRDTICTQLKTLPLAVVDQSLAFGIVRLAGTSTHGLLTQSCGLDLHPARFPRQSITRTRFAQLPIILHCIDELPQFDLYVGRSYLNYLRAWLTHGATSNHSKPSIEVMNRTVAKSN